MLLPMYAVADLIAIYFVAGVIPLMFYLLLALIVKWQMLLPFVWKMENNISLFELLADVIAICVED